MAGSLALGWTAKLCEFRNLSKLGAKKKRVNIKKYRKKYSDENEICRKV